MCIYFYESVNEAALSNMLILQMLEGLATPCSPPYPPVHSATESYPYQGLF